MSELRVISQPVDEEEVLAVTADEADANLIVETIETRGESCVDHLCGCL